MSCFVWIAWSCLGIFWVYLLSQISFDLSVQVVLIIQLEQINQQTCLLFFGLFVPIYPCVFSSFSIFSCCCSFFSCPSCLISYPGLIFFYSDSLGKHWFYHRLVSLPYKRRRLVQWCCLLGYLLIYCLILGFLPSLFSSLGSWVMIM